MTPPPVKVRAEELGLEVFQPDKVRKPEAVARLEASGPDAAVVVAFGQILPREVLDIPPLGCYNIHASLLPKYRGAAPINWAIIEGEAETGVTIIRMDEGMDTGDMLFKESMPIEPDGTTATLGEKLSALGGRMIVQALKLVEDGAALCVPQDEPSATKAPVMKKELGRIDWSMTPKEIERRVRGLDPWPGAFTTMDGETLKVWAAKLDEIGGYVGEPGRVVEVNKNGIKVMAKTGVLVITELQLQGKRRMSVADYIAGRDIPAGTLLGG
jgi:methionyl-tRNA formyltransferase